MELLQLQYFRHAAKTENLSRTAQAFLVPPSSVSVAIKRLETELGVRLFDRSANRLTLNANGRIFLRAVETADRALTRARIEMLDRAATPSGELRLLILTNRAIVTDSIAAFKRDYPAVTFHVRHEDTASGTYRGFDLLITDREIDADDFLRRPFIDEELRLAVNRDAPLAERGVVTLKDLRGEKFICMPKGTSLRAHMDRLFRSADVDPDIIIECDDPKYIRKYMKMGLGVTLFPLISWRGQIDDTFRLLPVDGGIYRRSCLYLRRGALHAAALFAETLELHARLQQASPHPNQTNKEAQI